MKPKNFPARKLRRQMEAAERFSSHKPENQTKLADARAVRTKKMK
jgi:hypothetical protein